MLNKVMIPLDDYWDCYCEHEIDSFNDRSYCGSSDNVMRSKHDPFDASCQTERLRLSYMDKADIR